MANSKARFPLNISMPTAPIAADLPPMARDEYLSARTKLANSVAKKRQLEAALKAVECEIWDAEGAYLTMTSAAHGGTGSVIRGFDAYLKPSAAAHTHGRKDRQRDKSMGDDDDPDASLRVFSNSSTTAESSVAQRSAEAEAQREREREAKAAERRAARASLTASRAGSPPESVRERSGTKLHISRASPRAGSPTTSARSSPAPSVGTTKRAAGTEGNVNLKKRRSTTGPNDEAGPPRKKKSVTNVRPGSPPGSASGSNVARKAP